ncbi:MAG: DegV family protein [Firmicutes bacterium]|nr:DegV family protein [Bacillota bacterium]
MVRILVDTSSDLPKEYREKYNIEWVYFPIAFDTESYLDRKDMNVEEFYNKIKETGIIPKTSQVTCEQFEPAIRKLLENEDDQVLVITLSSTLSGTYNEAVRAKENIDSDRVYVLDSNLATIMIGDLAITAAEMAENGASLEEIVKVLEVKKFNREAIFVLDTLEFLRKGGRISFAQSVVGGLLNIKVVLKYTNEGKIISFDKAKGKKQAVKIILEYIRKNRVEGNRLLLAHAVNEEFVTEVKNAIESELGLQVDMIAEIGAVIGTHVGPGTIAISC